MSSFSRGRSLLMFTALLTVALLACKAKKAPEPTPTPTATVNPEIEKAKKLEPQVKTLLDQLKAIETKAKSEPKVKSDKPLKAKLEKGKYVIVSAQWLTYSNYEAKADELKVVPTKYSLCGYHLDKPEITASDIGYSEECLAWEYIAVVRQRSLTLPKVNMTAKTFTPGSFVGDLLLFDAKTAEIKGRYTMNITNSDKLTYLENSTEKEWDEKARDDLVDNVNGVIDERLQGQRDSMGR